MKSYYHITCKPTIYHCYAIFVPQLHFNSWNKNLHLGCLILSVQSNGKHDNFFVLWVFMKDKKWNFKNITGLCSSHNTVQSAIFIYEINVYSLSPSQLSPCYMHHWQSRHKWTMHSICFLYFQQDMSLFFWHLHAYSYTPEDPWLE